MHYSCMTLIQIDYHTWKKEKKKKRTERLQAQESALLIAIPPHTPLLAIV